MTPFADAQLALRSHQADGLDGARGEACFHPDLPVFGGHFPGNPLVPGVYQLALVCQLMQAVAGLGQLQLLAIERCKWTRPLRPDDLLTVSARWQALEAGGWQVDGQVSAAAGRACQCRLRVASR
ncbi:MAG: hypothetical protein EA402_10690 [Planctomycetota bacterium]|nr:MAG: hypothetical protein EA402_10690 [Planctomycetota bacterium]